MIDIRPHKTLLVAKSGSQLFGTNTASSDLDIKGLFLPAKESLYLLDVPQQFTENTKPSDANQKNTSNDTDLTLWSIQFWAKLIARGDINAVSLLFSWTNPSAVLTGTDLGFLERFKTLDPLKLLSRKLSGMMGFAYSQAAKYSQKGKQLQAIQTAVEHLGSVAGTVGEVAETIVGLVADNSLAYIRRSDKGQEQLVVVEKRFDFSAKAAWALTPLKEMQEQYGHRARQALIAGGIDFKAYSHSYRVLEEMRLLHTNGKIIYPYEQELVSLLLKMKTGELDQATLSDFLDAKLAEVKQAEVNSVLPENTDVGHINNFILELYQNA